MTGAPQSLDWMTRGYEFFLAQLKLNDDEHLAGPSRLPGWTGRHLLSHVGHNAKALGRLAHWARTGEPTPMYPSPDARTAEIEVGAQWQVSRLRDFVEEEQERLDAALHAFTEPMWSAKVVTAQGRTVPASAIPWLRAREVWIHACDLPCAGDFAQMPGEFVDALIEDVVARRAAQGIELAVRRTDREAAGSGAGSGADIDVMGAASSRVEGGAADLARWLSGRGAESRLRTSTGAPPPDLPPWL